MKIRFWGVRGSMPTPWTEAMGVGGNTSCVQLLTDQPELVILDAGTGIAFLSKFLIEQQHHRSLRIHLFLTHTHWDHIQGIPFFRLLNYPDNHITIYGANKPDKSFEDVIRAQMDYAYFPVSLSAVQAQLDFCPLQPEQEVLIGELKVQAEAFNHPGGVYGYRFEKDRNILVYATDMEYTHADLDPRLIAFAENANLLIFDAQYTPDEYEQKQGWGHSNYLLATHLAKSAHVKKLYLFSHDPDHSDQMLNQIENMAKQEFSGTFLAKEGQIIPLSDD